MDVSNVSMSAVYTKLRASFPEASADTQDGLRLDWKDRWVHLRPSGTEPVIRAIAEAPTEADARALVASARRPLEELAR
jgi:phosphomannomutase